MPNGWPTCCRRSERRAVLIVDTAVACGEIGFSGTVPKEGTAADEIAALAAELQGVGGLP